MTMKLFLLSNSKTFGLQYLEHAEKPIREFFGSIKSLLFIPYASADYSGYETMVKGRFYEFGITVQSIHTALDPVKAINESEAIFVGGGNTFLLLDTLYKNNLVQAIRERVLAGTPYMGSSAGTNIASPTIMTTNDMPIVYPPSFDSLHLVPFQINPHYIDTDPTSKHMGETREERLREFVNYNKKPVVGLREGSWITVINNTYVLEGKNGGVLFEPNRNIIELAIGLDLPL